MSDNIKYLKPIQLLILVTVLVVIFGFTLFINSAQNRYNEVNSRWLEYSETETEIVQTVLNLKTQLGYGGFIHAFKNYVLRGESRYLQRLEEAHKELLNNLTLLRIKLTSPEEQQALKTIGLTVSEYWSNIELAKQAHLEGLPPKQVDYLVKVDDSYALASLKVLEDAIQLRAQRVRNQTDQSITVAESFLKLGHLINLPILLLAILLYYFIRKVSRTTDALLTARKWVDTVLDTAPDATLCVDQQGHIIRSNLMAEKLFGYSADELLNMQVEELIPKRFATEHRVKRNEFFQAPTAREMGRGKLLLALLKNGDELPVEISLSHTSSETGAVAIASIRDITEQEQNRKLLIDAKEEAVSAFKQLKEAKDDLVEAEKMAALGGLVAGVAHEINTPIGNALSSATYLQDRTHNLDDLYQQEELSADDLESYLAKSREASAMITVNLTKAAQLINSFKNVAVDQTGGERREFNLNQYLQEILTSIKPLYKKTEIIVGFECPDSLCLHSYPGALSQSVTNLIANAINHAFDTNQGCVSIVASQQDSNVIIEVSDNGKGIPESLQKKVFEPFFTTKRNHGGSGLGLQIVYNLVTHNLGGDITLISQEGKGSVFRIVIPQNYQIPSTAETTEE